MIEQDQSPRTEPSSEENWPDWARHRIAHGREVGRGRTDDARQNWRQAGYIGAVVFNAIFLAIAHNLVNWHLPFITPAWDDVVWAIDLSVGGSIVANAVFMGYDERWFRTLVQIPVTMLALVAWITVVQVFPLNFGDTLANDMAHFVGVLVAFALVIAIVVQVIVWIVEQTRRALR
jgi:hypothetical protein